MSGPTIEERISAELDELERDHIIPDGAQTLDELLSAHPALSRDQLRPRLTGWVKEGRWRKARRGLTTVYWPAK